jgi:hypothetical protein
LTHPLPVQIEQLYHNINTWRTACRVIRERYADQCAASGMLDTLNRIEHDCESLAQDAVALYSRLVDPSLCEAPAGPPEALPSLPWEDSRHYDGLVE